MSIDPAHDDQSPLVRATNLGRASRVSTRRVAMTRQERLEKLQANAISVQTPKEKRGPARSFKEIAARPAFREPIELSEILEVRGKRRAGIREP